MQDPATESSNTDHAGLIRLGGLAMLAGLAIYIVANEVLKVFPPENPSLAELQTYLSNEAGTWAIVHGIRYVALVCIVLFAAGLFVRTCCIRKTSTTGWGIVGLIGTGMMVVNLLITNGIETLNLWTSIACHSKRIRFGRCSISRALCGQQRSWRGR